MNNIYLNEKTFLKFKNKYSTKKDGIYKYDDIFVKELLFDSGYIFNSTIYTVNSLNDNKNILPKSLLIPNGYLYVNNKIKCLTMPYIYGNTLKETLDNNDISLEEKIYYLKEVGKILEDLKQTKNNIKIYLNDLHESNIIIDNKGKIYAVDLDTCKINNNINFPSKYLNRESLIRYSKDKYPIVDNFDSPGYVCADENSDLFCYIIMILNFISGTDISRISDKLFLSYLNYLIKVGFDSRLIDSLSKIIAKEDNVNPYKLLDTIDEKCKNYIKRNKNV